MCEALSNSSVESDSKYSETDNDAYEIQESEEKRNVERPPDKASLTNQDSSVLRRSTRQRCTPDRFVPVTSNMIVKQLMEDHIALIAHDPEVPRTYKQATSPYIVQT